MHYARFSLSAEAQPVTARSERRVNRRSFLRSEGVFDIAFPSIAIPANTGEARVWLTP